MMIDNLLANTRNRARQEIIDLDLQLAASTPQTEQSEASASSEQFLAVIDA